MGNVTISLRVDKKVHNQMKIHDEINWSAMLRKSIIERLEKLTRIERTRAQHATKIMDSLRKKKSFDKGKPATDIIREWREKRK